MTINYYGELEMKRFCILSLYIFFVSLLYAQTVEVDGAYRWTGVNKSETGLDYVFVIPSSSQATIRFNSTSGSPVKWYRFDRTGINNKTPISNGNSLTYSSAEKDYGYVIEQGDASIYLWLSTYKEVSSLYADEEYANQCEDVRLAGTGLDIAYYTVNGKWKGVNRAVAYKTWKWDDTLKDLKMVEDTVQGLISKSGETVSLYAPAPYEKTLFTVIDSIPYKGWNGAIKTFSTSDEYEPRAILMKAVVSQQLRDAKNEWNTAPEDGSFGGSAPVEMEFKAYVSGDNYYAWEFMQENPSEVDDPIVDAIYPDKILRYTFKDEGTTYVRLKATNSYCSRDTSFTITVGESRLEAPNIFSPGTSPGVNDEWKVAYKSIVQFKCWIFNRWGVEIFRFSDPAQGWDGKYKGKLVPPGVYYYIIEAKGVDNQNYKLKGNINILRPRN